MPRFPVRFDALQLPIPTLAAACALSAALSPAVSAQTCPSLTFAAAVNSTLPASGRSLAAGDVDDDADLDLISCYSVGSAPPTPFVAVFKNDGSGTLAAPITTACISSPGAVAVGDFNHDSKLDVAVASSTAGSNTVSIMLGNNDGTFQAGVSYTVVASGGTRNILVADFNGDAKLDLAIATGPASGLAVMLGNGDGSFQASTVYSSGSNVLWVTSGDFNHDTKLDLAIVTANVQTVAVLTGNADGTFNAPITTTVTGVAAVGADLNSDGYSDIVLATSASGSKVNVLINNTMGGFAPAVTYDGGTFPQSVGVADFNGDGKLDIVGTNIVSGVGMTYVYQNNGDGTFQSGVGISTVINNFRVLTADFNNDGKPDFAVSSSNQTAIPVVLNTSLLCPFTCCRGVTCARVAAAACPPNGSLPNGAGSIIATGPLCVGITYTGCCSADFDHNGTSSIDDLFIYINAWLATSPFTKINGDGLALPSIDDLFVYINLWLVGCV